MTNNLDITPITTEIARLIVAGTTGSQLLAAVARRFPELTRSEFVSALQDATAAAEKQAARRH
jgi:hypothetical protein